MLPIRYWPSGTSSVGRNRKVARAATARRSRTGPAPPAARVAIEPGDQGVGGVAELADVEIVDIRIHLRRRRHRRAAEHDGLAGGFGAPVDVADLRRLHMHAADHDRIRPGEIGGCRPRDVLVDETDLPAFRQIGRKHQQTLRRHEGLDVVEQREGVREGAKGRRIGREDTEDLAAFLNLDRSAQGTPPIALGQHRCTSWT